MAANMAAANRLAENLTAFKHPVIVETIPHTHAATGKKTHQKALLFRLVQTPRDPICLDSL
jgi:hypothetical protein